ncbi:MAG: hypothetical protein GQ559_05935, partial [Desulfobulbaceae bacterium]|nr:hypothetical protein [Desulfobulbaceae bacterium]
TLVVAVRLSGETSTFFPLVEGMFVRVVIQGKTVGNAFVLPRQAVTYEDTVYIAAGERLQTRKVTVVRKEEGRAIIATGLFAGDKVITTRLEQPLENTLLTIVADQEGRQ